MEDKKNKGNGVENPMDVEHELPSGETTPDEATAREPIAAVGDSAIDKLKAENAAYLDRLARLQAEFENFRKRSLREQEEFRGFALADALKQMLPLLDSLDRALKTENASTEDFRSGIELIDRQFHDVFTKLGVEPIVAQGQPFDPSLHQAIQMVDSTDVPDNHVIDELQRGYRIKSRLLRPSMVTVSRNPEK